MTAEQITHRDEVMEAQATQPSAAPSCACVSIDARTCYTTRYKLSTWEDTQEDDDKCECVCHQADNDDPMEWV